MGEINLNKSENSVTLTLAESVYSLNTIYATAYVFLDRAYIHLDKKENNFLVVLTPKKEIGLETLGKAFLDELINQGHYFSQLEKNKEIIKLLVERAFFSTDPHLAEKAEEEEIKDIIKELEKENDPEFKTIIEEIKNEHNKVQ